MVGVGRGAGSATYRLQASMEYLFVYVTVFIILVVIAFVIFNFASISSKNILPAKCEFDYGIDCHAIIVASNSTGTMVALLGSNMLPYPIKNVSLNINSDGSATSTKCSPGIVKPGQTLLCVAKMNTYAPVLSFDSGNLMANASYCGISSANCSNAEHESYSGDYSTNVNRLIVPRVSIVLSLPSVIKANQSAGISVGLDVFGIVLPVANPQLVSSNPSISIASSINSTGSYVSYISSGGSVGSTTVSASYAGINANETVVFIPSSSRILIANFLSNNVTVVNASSGAMETIANTITPSSIAVAPNQTYAYVAETVLNKIAILNLINYTVAGTIVVGSFPSSIAVEGNYAFVGDSGSNQISVVNIQTGNVIDTIGTKTYPAFVSLSGDGSRLFVVNQLSSVISSINTSSLNYVRNVSVKSLPYAVASSYNGNLVYATLPGSGAIAVINETSGLVTYFNAGIIPFGIAYDRANNCIYATDIGSSSLLVINATSHNVIKTIETGFLPSYVTISPGGHYAYVANSGFDTVSIVNTTTNAVEANYATGVLPSWIALQQ
ncbi:MAG: YncE family protein [Candidatus Micrarchaeia archaeon]